MRGLTLSLFAAAAIIGTGTLASAQPQQQAGVAGAVRGQVALARPSLNIVGRQVESGNPIFLGDAITSGKSSGMQVLLLDETVFSIGPNSEISIDEFVYDPATNNGKVTASVAKGVFRFITGKIARKRPEDMTVRLPTATIGIRGTKVAGAVRAAAGDDAAVDQVFAGLKGTVPDAENAKDFVVLLGPGDENNTNDRGGAFIFTPNPPQKAESGLSAGAPQPGVPGSIASGTRISRAGSGIVGYGDGTSSPPIPDVPISVTTGISSGVDTQPESGAEGSPADSNAQEASNTDPAQAGSLSGNDVAEANAGGEQVAALAQSAQQNSDITDPTAGAGDNSFQFEDLLQVNSGSASSSQNLNLGPFQLSGSLNINFGDPHVFFNFSISCVGTCTDFSSGTIQTSPFINIAGRTGPAVVTNSEPEVINGGNCSDGGCSLSIAFTGASAVGPSATANISFFHEGEGDTAVAAPLSN